MMEKIKRIVTLSLISLVVFTLTAIASDVSTTVPEQIDTQIGYFVQDSHTVLIGLRYAPTEELMSNPPEFTLEFGEDSGEYYTKIPFQYENAINEDGFIETKFIVLAELKPGTVYYYHIVTVFLGVPYDTGEKKFMTPGVI